MVGVTPAGGAGAEKVSCKLCDQRLPRSKIRMHVGGHILKDKAMQVSTVCGFCGGLGCHTTINAPSGKAVAVMYSTCPYAPRKDARDAAVKFSLKSARTGSDTSPCTNTVMKCIFCFQDTYIWKYGMTDHVARCHNEDTLVEAGTERAKKFKKYYTVSEMEERKVLKKFQAEKLRPRRDTDSLPPGAHRSVSGNGAVGSGVPGIRPQGEQEEEEKEGDDDDEDDEEEEDEDEDEDQEDQDGGKEDEEADGREKGVVEGQRGRKRRPAGSSSSSSEAPHENVQDPVRTSKRGRPLRALRRVDLAP